MEEEEEDVQEGRKKEKEERKGGNIMISLINFLLAFMAAKLKFHVTSNSGVGNEKKDVAERERESSRGKER